MSDNESGSIDATPFTPIQLSEEAFAGFVRINQEAAERLKVHDAQTKADSDRWWTQFAEEHQVDLKSGIFAVGQSPDVGFCVVRLTPDEADRYLKRFNGAQLPAVDVGAPAGEVVH